MVKRVRSCEQPRSRGRSARAKDISGFTPAHHLLPGEDPAEFESLRLHVSKALEPRDALEENWAEDVVCNEWEVRRYRRLKASLLAEHAIEPLIDLLRGPLEAEYEGDAKNHGVHQSKRGQSGRAANDSRADESESAEDDEDDGQSSEASDEAALRATDLTKEWKLGRAEAVSEVRRLLRSDNRSLDDALVPAFAERLDEFQRIDEMIMMFEARRNAAVREFDRHRDAMAIVVEAIERK